LRYAECARSSDERRRYIHDGEAKATWRVICATFEEHAEARVRRARKIFRLFSPFSAKRRRRRPVVYAALSARRTLCRYVIFAVDEENSAMARYEPERLAQRACCFAARFMWRYMAARRVAAQREWRSEAEARYAQAPPRARGSAVMRAMRGASASALLCRQLPR